MGQVHEVLPFSLKHVIMYNLKGIYIWVLTLWDNVDWVYMSLKWYRKGVCLWMIATDGLQAMYSATNPKNFPDGGAKLRQQIHELEKEISRKKDNSIFRLSIIYLLYTYCRGDITHFTAIICHLNAYVFFFHPPECPPNPRHWCGIC